MAVFVSFSHKDEESARSLKRALNAHGFDVWQDDGIRPGDRWVESATRGLRASSAVVLLIGADPSDADRNEWSHVLALSWDPQREVRLVPVLLPNADPPAFLRDQQVMRVGDDANPWDRVVDALEGSDAGISEWRVSDTTRTVVAERLTALEKLAATLPHDVTEQG